jgi:hypothetical protein
MEIRPQAMAKPKGVPMQAKRKLITAASVVVLAMVGTTYLGVSAQENQVRIAHSSGQGTLKVGDEQFKLTSVIVKLIDDRKAELTLVSDITIFLTATWSNHGESQQEFDLDLSGSNSRGGLEGTGKVVLGNGGKSVARLTLKGVSRATRRPVEVNFEGK